MGFITFAVGACAILGIVLVAVGFKKDPGAKKMNVSKMAGFILLSLALIFGAVWMAKDESKMISRAAARGGGGGGGDIPLVV